MLTEKLESVNARAADCMSIIHQISNVIVEVLSVEPGTTPGLVATVAVRVGGIVLRDVRVNNKGRGTFVNFPSRKVGARWVSLVELTSPALRDAVERTILASVGGVRL